MKVLLARHRLASIAKGILVNMLFGLIWFVPSRAGLVSEFEKLDAESPEQFSFLEVTEVYSVPERRDAGGLDSIWCANLCLFLLHLKNPFHYVHKSWIYRAAEPNSCVAYRYWYPEAKLFYGASHGIRERSLQMFQLSSSWDTSKYLRCTHVYSDFSLLISK